MNIYADNAATTRMSDAAIDTMLAVTREYYGNPSSLYEIGQRAKEKLEECREEIAAVIREAAASKKIIGIRLDIDSGGAQRKRKGGEAEEISI